VGWLADGTPWTMGCIVGVSGVGVLLSVLLLVRTPARG
jgi:DHA1 family bicyclomycin/chloramphenicol resistance-like MFS transporter